MIIRPNSDCLNQAAHRTIHRQLYIGRCTSPPMPSETKTFPKKCITTFTETNTRYECLHLGLRTDNTETRLSLYKCFKQCMWLTRVIRLDALAKALSVIATATWLGGWLAGWVAGCPSHSGIVSKRLNLSENFFDHLKAPSF